MALLSVKNVSKTFGGLMALTQVSFDVHEGEILALIGPNGAGKTTMFNVICGYYRPDEGQILFQEEEITAHIPSEICRMGLCRTFQIVQPFFGMTVLENVIVGAFNKFSRTRDASARAELILREVGLAAVKNQPAENLNIATWKRLEVAKALATGPRLLLLDEVLAGLNPREVSEALDLIRIIRDRGISIILVEHVMQAVMSLSDRIVVLQNGTKIAEGLPKEVTEDPVVIDAYLGRDFDMV